MELYPPPLSLLTRCVRLVASACLNQQGVYSMPFLLRSRRTCKHAGECAQAATVATSHTHASPHAPRKVTQGAHSTIHMGACKVNTRGVSRDPIKGAER